MMIVPLEAVARHVPDFLEAIDTAAGDPAARDAATRIASSRWSQLISAAVYIVFVALTTPLTAGLHGQYDDDALLIIVAMVSPLLVVPLVAAAAFSQFSAAVADTVAAVGDLEEVSVRTVRERWGYLAVGAGAIALTWAVDTFEVIALASRAFAFYYLLQCLVAISVAKTATRKAAFGAIAAILAFVTIFGEPAG